jgi:hypothetical protein
MAVTRRFREHDPEKWTPIFRKDHAQTMKDIAIKWELSQILPYRSANRASWAGFRPPVA